MRASIITGRQADLPAAKQARCGFSGRSVIEYECRRACRAGQKPSQKPPSGSGQKLTSDRVLLWMPKVDAKKRVWKTSDGRELTIDDMFRPHIGNARALLKLWLKRERDPDRRAELKLWIRDFNRELSKRERAWRKQRKQNGA